ncbi:MAG TPA: ring-opening amidohydrolase [Geminicoccus sp.]|jgi:cyanuric acid amidohydrolase|uniref:cyanuric acid amidohydrolase n=1 Tax=Geminicoccus sp. TaxID=2024832 RepID=UPI002E30DA85|nr:ring-opening amidohydrolase [Geminicoccus sp.]HEX2526705.1 ring-opening amidohydrolase [Geminicoccus sp.]
MPQARVHRIPARAPDDMRGIARLIQDGVIDPTGILAILGKTEGNGCVNDFTRAFAVSALKAELSRHLTEASVNRIVYVMSGGTEGGLAPHWLVLERSSHDEGRRPALAIGTHHTADLPARSLGRLAQVEMVRQGVLAAMKEARLADAAEAHFVQIKVPLLTAERIAAARSDVRTTDPLKSMGLSRAAAALGVAAALGEVAPGKITEDAIGSDHDLWSGRASTSAGAELLNHEIVVMGMSGQWSGPLAIDHAVMTDQLDIDPVREAVIRLGLPVRAQLVPAERRRVVAVLAKAEAGSTGRLRGHRHTMLDDSDISSTRHARAFVGGVLAGLIGHAELFVSGGAEHQGPDGGGPVAIIAERG